MAKDLLKDPKIRAERPDTKIKYLNDGGGLRLRIKPDGVKSWLFRYKRADGTEQTMSFGEYPAVTLAAARERANETRGKIAADVDPLDERRAKRDAAKNARKNTVRALAKEWVSVALVQRGDKGAEALRALEKDVFPIIGDMQPANVQHEHIMKIADAMRARGVGRMVNVVVSQIRQMYRWAIVRRIVSADPTFAIEKKDAGGVEPPCQRWLKDDELKFLFANIEGAVDRRALLLFLLLLSTGNRIGETCMARWSEIDFESREWLIPAAHRKSNPHAPAGDHLAPLSEFALAVLTSVKALAGDDPRLFPGASAKEITRAFTERQTDPATKPPGKRRKYSTDLCTSGGHWTPHDLRRTARTLMSRLKVPRDIAERVLSHKVGDKLDQTYDVWAYIDEKREAVDRLGGLLETMFTPKAARAAKVKKKTVARTNEFTPLSEFLKS